MSEQIECPSCNTQMVKKRGEVGLECRKKQCVHDRRSTYIKAVETNFPALKGGSWWVSLNFKDIKTFSEGERST